MALREYECNKHGIFEIKQRISEPCISYCPICNILMVRVILTAPLFHGFRNNRFGEPDYNKDSKEYEQWQRNKYNTYLDKLHPDNNEKSETTAQKLIERTK